MKDNNTQTFFDGLSHDWDHRRSPPCRSVTSGSEIMLLMEWDDMAKKEYSAITKSGMAHQPECDILMDSLSINGI